MDDSSARRRIRVSSAASGLCVPRVHACMHNRCAYQQVFVCVCVCVCVCLRPPPACLIHLRNLLDQTPESLYTRCPPPPKSNITHLDAIRTTRCSPPLSIAASLLASPARSMHSSPQPALTSLRCSETGEEGRQVRRRDDTARGGNAG
jgi:hypothetical protein